MRKVIFSAILAVLLLISTLSAHIPEFVTGNKNYTSEPVIVKEPEISYAYYGRLQGSPHVYRIDSSKTFHLYVSLLVPYVGQEETSEVGFHIIKDGEKIVVMHDYENWTKWYEEYGGDWYLQGPAYEADVGAGVYLIEVHSDMNSEDYTIAVGKVERFGLGEILQTLLVLPLMKAFFWGNYLLILVYIIVTAVAIYMLYWIYKKFIRRSVEKNRVIKLIVAVIICQLAGVIGSIFTTPAVPTWYASLEKPVFTPAGWVIGVVWTIIFFFMGVSLYLIWEKGLHKKDVRFAIYVFSFQLFLNIMWSVLFFGLRNPFFALIEIVVLWLVIVFNIMVFYRISKKAGYLLIPYIVWVSFASFLNYALWVMNI